MKHISIKFGCAGRTRGFSLIELAVVLVVVSFLLGGLLIPLSSQISQRDREDTAHRLDQAREALFGFALAYGYLPCPMNPDTSKAQAKPTDSTYGEETPRDLLTGKCTLDAGILPWKTLGLSFSYDSWGHGRSAQSDPWLGYFRYAVDPNFSNNGIGSAPNPPPKFGLTTSATSLSVVDSDGTTALSSAGEGPVAIVYSTGQEDADNDGLRADGANAKNDPDNPSSTPSAVYEGGTPSATFDDMTVWIGRLVLFNRMVAAGRLP